MTVVIVFLAALALALILWMYARRKNQEVLTQAFAQPAERAVVRRGGAVIAYHPEVRELGEAILAAGGNAFDAFVAAAAVENVLAEGASSLAGPLGVLTYRASDGQVMYLDADFNDPHHPNSNNSGRETLGQFILVPGAPAGLEALAKKYGTLPFSELLKPAMKLASEGFAVKRTMAQTIEHTSGVLKRSDYGRTTFLRNGKPLAVGDTFRQPEVARFLERLGREGSAYVYEGDWSQRFLSTVSETGGSLTRNDLAGYAVRWCKPWTTTYRGYTLHSSSGSSYGGLWVLLALKTLEHATLPETTRYWNDADGLEMLIRISHQVWSERDIFDYRVLADSELVESLLTEKYSRSVWERVSAKTPLVFMGVPGSHSYHIITTDAQGNIASGTTTIYSHPWADGIFVEGVPLTCAGRIPWNTAPGERRLSPLSIHLALQNGKPKFGVGTISNSIVEAAFQFLVKLIDYQMPVRETVSSPRFGTFPPKGMSLSKLPRLDANWLDPRVDRKVVKQLEKRGLKVQQKGLVDTGLGLVMSVDPEGQFEGVPAPLPYVADPFK
jgi:gamma-glutamyltranspeptidase/glutathione hydrolase